MRIDLAQKILFILDRDYHLKEYSKILSKSIRINPLSTKVEVDFELSDLIESIGARRDKLVRLKELLEDEDIKELLDIEVRVR